MFAYPRLNLDNEEETKTWPSLAHEYWRRTFRDNYGRGNYYDNEVQATFSDVVAYCQKYPVVATVETICPENLVHFTSGDPSQLARVVPFLDAMVRTGAAPIHLGMLSNWVTLLEYAIEQEQLQACAEHLKGTLEYLTAQPAVHLWDNALVYMAVLSAEKAENTELLHALAQVCAVDTNAARAASRLMTVMEHTNAGPLWWRTINVAKGGSEDAPLPTLPNAHETVKRKERSTQAWWRYAPEMHATPEYQWVHQWMHSLMSPSRDVAFSTNGLL